MSAIVATVPWQSLAIVALATPSETQIRVAAETTRILFVNVSPGEVLLIRQEQIGREQPSMRRVQVETRQRVGVTLEREGDTVVEGLILDQEGAAVAGARLRWRFPLWRSDRCHPRALRFLALFASPHKSDSSPMAAAWWVTVDERGIEHEVVATDDGRFRITGLPRSPGTLTLAVEGGAVELGEFDPARGSVAVRLGRR
jgi:hypothetical protein